MVGSNSSIIIASYNTGAVTGTSDVGCVVGYTNGPITASYNTGAVTGTGNVGGVVGNHYGGTLTANYWFDHPSGNATNGNGSAGNNTDATPFSGNPGGWPTDVPANKWGVGNDPLNGKYWQSLGSWNSGSPVYPKLWWE